MTELLELGPAEVHLWGLSLDEPALSEAGLLSTYERLLSADEAAAHERLRRAEHRRQYLLARVFVRSVLSRHAAVPPEAWRFVRNEHGRPAVAPELAGEPPLQFNLSHTPGLLLCGVVRGRALGVDIEDTRRDVDLEQLTCFCFGSEAARALRELPAAEQRARFFVAWTLQEAQLKARGLGWAAAPLPAAGWLEGEEAAHWRFALLEPQPHHVAALVVAGGAEAGLSLHLRKLVPLCEEAVMACRVVALSAEGFTLPGQEAESGA